MYALVHTRVKIDWCLTCVCVCARACIVYNTEYERNVFYIDCDKLLLTLSEN